MGRKTLYNLVFFALILIICFAMAEGLLRGYSYLQNKDLFEGTGLHEKVDDPKLSYVLKPNVSQEKNGVLYVVNSDGIRDIEYGAKTDRSFRIVVLGDSITFGSSVENDERYTEYLEDKLNPKNADSYDYEIINLGVSGYSPANEFALLKEKGLGYEPDFLIVGYALNDAVATPFDTEDARFTHCRINIINMPINCKVKKVLASSELLRMSRNLIKDDEQQKDLYVEYHNDPERWDYLNEQYDELKDIASEEGLEVLVVIFPIFSDFENYQWLEIHKKVGNMVEEKGFYVLDGYDVYKKYDSEELRVLAEDPWHPDPEGHKIIADAIFEKLISKDILP